MKRGKSGNKKHIQYRKNTKTTTTTTMSETDKRHNNYKTNIQKYEVRAKKNEWKRIYKQRHIRMKKKKTIATNCQKGNQHMH